MNYSWRRKIEIRDQDGQLGKAEIERRGAGKVRTFRLSCMLTIIVWTAIWCSAAWGQTEPGQTVASIPAKDGELLVQNGANNDVWLVAANERVSVNAEEALRVAGWIKEGKIGEYGDTGSVRFRRESRILVVTFAPDQAGKKELRLKEAEALAARRRAGLGAPERQRSRAMNWRQP
jgi:hypothetical protein